MADKMGEQTNPRAEGAVGSRTSTQTGSETDSDPQSPGMKPFWTLWSGQSVSLVGSQAVQFALIWWLTALTGSATILTTATMLGLLPQVLLGPFIGALIDRWNRKTVMLVADSVVAAASVVLAVLFYAGIAQVEHVLGLLLVRSLGSAFHSPAMLASTTLMVPRRHFTRVQGVNQSVQGLLLIIGAPIGAFLYSLIPIADVMLVDVGTALPAIVPLLFIHVPQPRTEHSDRAVSLWQGTLAGFRYLLARRGHVALVFLASGVNLLLIPAFSLLPLLVLERLQGDARQLGWITSAFGAGMLAGGALLGAWGGFSRRIVTTLVAMLALGVAVLGVGATPSGAFWWMLAAMAVVGLFVPIVNGPVRAILQATIAPEMQGRVFTLLGSLAGATGPVGLLAAAPVAELVGVGTWYFAGGAMCLFMGLAGLLTPALVRIEGPETR